MWIHESERCLVKKLVFFSSFRMNQLSRQEWCEPCISLTALSNSNEIVFFCSFITRSCSFLHFLLIIDKDISNSSLSDVLCSSVNYSSCRPQSRNMWLPLSRNKKAENSIKDCCCLSRWMNVYFFEWSIRKLVKSRQNGIKTWSTEQIIPHRATDAKYQPSTADIQILNIIQLIERVFKKTKFFEYSLKFFFVNFSLSAKKLRWLATTTDGISFGLR